ncbi:MAG TPA: hypothetical protein VFQ26_03910 [Nitrospiraceae bacterium]|nr:hypothetical protein [Nitrospiraceae bacterium]
MLTASFALRNRGYGGILLHSFQLDSREEVAKNAPDYSRRARHGLYQDKLNAFMGKAGSDIGAALSANMALLGDRLGLYKAIVNAGSHDSAERRKLRSIWYWKPGRNPI